MAVVKKQITIDSRKKLNMVLIQIPEDAARLILEKHFRKISKSKGWISALVFLVTFSMSLCTSDFADKEIFGQTVSADKLSALFDVAWLAALAYLIYTIINAVKCKDSVDDIINDLKSNK